MSTKGNGGHSKSDGECHASGRVGKQSTVADVLIVGGGIAGSTLAILLARQGLAVELFEQGRFPKENVCGEGLMHAGVAVLERMGLADIVGGASLLWSALPPQESNRRRPLSGNPGHALCRLRTAPQAHRPSSLSSASGDGRRRCPHRHSTTRELATVLHCSLMDTSLSPVDDDQLTNSLHASDTSRD